MEKEKKENEIEVSVKNDDVESFDTYNLDDHYCSCEECDCEECDCDCDDCDCCHCSCHDNGEYCEEDLDNNLMDDFSTQVKERGQEYYDDGRILELYKSGNFYFGKVEGHDNNVYNAKITVYDDNDADYECTCPCDYPCKHIYAMLMAISNQEYEEVELKDEIMPIVSGIHEMIEKIPADELKKYLLSEEGMDHTDFCLCSFNNYFRKYLPKQSYEYYYNNLYNAFVLDNDYMLNIDNYISCARDYLKDGDYQEAFKIIKSIVEAAHDSDVLDLDDDDFELINKIGMLLRIIYRKGDLKSQKEVKEWNDHLKINNYYDNYYLEDVILSLN